MNLNYVYLYAYHETEKELCQLEQRALFGYSTEDEWIVSATKIDPSRSPFIKERLDVIEQADSIDSLILTISSFGETFHQFKVVYRKVGKDETSFPTRKRVEKEIGLRLKGTPDLINPKVELVVCKVAESWLIGKRKKVSLCG
ncbi:hypothetical protein [Bacillus coahuilensis]|uniref:hypothetical protein n=1 Tax=Bacillus coahuilensis TaxID=408580 RepID=UPI001ED974DE|nr:hypothetical protein [Bacillus coahuilensis]